MLPQNKPSYQASAPEAMDTEQLTATLDQLPVTRRHARLLGVTGIGWALDAMDIGLISFVMAALIAYWGISSGQASLLGSIGFLGMAIGATLGGRLRAACLNYRSPARARPATAGRCFGALCSVRSSLLHGSWRDLPAA